MGLKSIFQTLVNLFLVVVAVSVMGCASYQLGDISRVYCGSTDEAFRAQIKAKLTERGVSIGIDYCRAHGLVDAIRGQHGAT
ncbi:hypothetical protein [Thalassotalea euphylliae]|uniref:Lipoprotein n=1 Tax=Thalassotalea euphylliae TaxID=1655234 RepID=A0A3E0U2Y4_9GAMM|nr:hypothetical protein [Thalassotalea euphylliae]REL31084.1 hypothetical protein DXX94_10360 [Thalassotalea euphylliae]